MTFIIKLCIITIEITVEGKYTSKKRYNRGYGRRHIIL